MLAAMDPAGWPEMERASERWGAGPVDVPRRHVLEVGRRRHRRITAPSGLLLFACMFLPAIRSCGTSVYPTEMPYFWHPYVYGLALCVASFALTAHSVRLAVRTLRALACIAVAGGAGLLLLSTGLGAVELALAAILLAAIGLRGHGERRLAITGIVISALCLLWFGLWAGSKDALVGVYLSLGASIFLLAGSLLWLSEI
jgi:hypothetical protein